jgi:alkaline phosphatase
MGFAGAGYALYVERLAYQTMSVDCFSRKVAKMFEKNNNLSFDDVKPLITEAFGFHFEGDPKKDPMVLGKEDIGDIAKAFDHDFALYASRVEENTKYDGMKRYHLGGACRLVMSNKCGLGWTSGSHTAMPVLTTASGCGAEHFSGFLENADIGRIMKGFYE